MVTAEEREAVLKVFEEGLQALDRTRYPVNRMRWTCRLRDPQGQRYAVAEYTLSDTGHFRRVWVLPDVLWPSKPHG